MSVKKLFDTKHLSLFETKKGFIYAERRGINSTAALCYRFNRSKNCYEFLVRYQPLPINKFINKIDKFLYPCCITGSIEKNESEEQNIIKEVFEESGYIISKKNIISVNKATATTQMNEIVFHYLINLDGCKKTKCMNDGSFFESISVNKWINEKKLINLIINNKEIYLSSLGICYLMFSFLKNNK